jgi:cell wall-associated NlpC family hydrolase
VDIRELSGSAQPARDAQRTADQRARGPGRAARRGRSRRRLRPAVDPRDGARHDRCSIAGNTPPGDIARRPTDALPMNHRAPRNRLLRALTLLGASLLCAPAQGGTLSLALSDRMTTSAAAPVASPAPPQALDLRLSEDASDSIVRQLVLLAGSRMLGTGYAFGADDEGGVDCSALVRRMFRSAGIELPRTTREIRSIGRPVRRADLVAGDLLFYRWGPSGLHVAVYLPGDRILHASSAQGEVVLTALNEAWDRRLVAARRLI